MVLRRKWLMVSLHLSLKMLTMSRGMSLTSQEFLSSNTLAQGLEVEEVRQDQLLKAELQLKKLYLLNSLISSGLQLLLTLNLPMEPLLPHRNSTDMLKSLILLTSSQNTVQTLSQRTTFLSLTTTTAFMRKMLLPEDCLHKLGLA